MPTGESPPSISARKPRRTIPCYARTASPSAETTSTHRATWCAPTGLDQRGRTSPVPHLRGLDRPQLLLLNARDCAYPAYRADEKSLRNDITPPSHFTDPLPRRLVWAAAWDQTRDGQWPASRY